MYTFNLYNMAWVKLFVCVTINKQYYGEYIGNLISKKTIKTFKLISSNNICLYSYY